MIKISKLFLFFLILPIVSLSQNSVPNSYISFLQTQGNQSVPTANAIDTSLASLNNDSLKPVTIATLTRLFAYLKVKQQDVLLVKINLQNKDLAETLLVFRKRLTQASVSEKNMQQMVSVVFMHYLTNTEEGAYIKGSCNPEEAFVLLTEYAQSFGFTMNKSPGDNITFNLASRKETCTNCSLHTFNNLRRAGVKLNRMRYGRDDVISAATFDFYNDGYALENAAILADFCNLAYFEPIFIQRQLAERGYSSFKWIGSQNSDTQVFLTQKEGYQIICFRGTESLKDIITDLRVNKTDAFDGKGKVHSGFHNAVDDVYKKIEQAININRKIIVTGHSLGGALAQLMAYRLAVNKYQVSGIYTYGSPRVGNSEFKTEYDARLAKKTYLHINNKDLVTSIPFEILGYRHLGAIERTFNENHKITLKNKEGAFIKPTINRRFDELDLSLQQELQHQMDLATKSMVASTQFLTKPLDNFIPMSYQTVFEEGELDDHGIYQYLFKLGCAVIEKEMNYIKN